MATLEIPERFRHLDKTTGRHAAMLEKRMEHLETRVNQNKAIGRELSWDASEAAALRFVLNILENREAGS